jgi:hypothetical protein
VWIKAKNSNGESDFSPGASGKPIAPASITVSFDNGDITVKKGNTGIPAEGFTLSKAANESAALSAEGYTGAAWYLDGAKLTGNSPSTLKASELDLGIHSLTFTGKRDGLTYSSKPIPLRVTQ